MHDLEVYPFWQMTENQRLVVRFIPDLNEDNYNGFVDEFLFHRVKIDGKQKMALCSRKHEDNQPCYYCIAARNAFDTHAPNAMTHWRKQQYIGNVIIINDPLDITDPNNPKTYRLPMGKQLFNDIKSEIMCPKIAEIPSDYYNGNNFVITREMHGGHYPKYSGTFQRSSRLTDEQIELAKNSLLDLSEFRPKLYSSNFQDELSKDLCWGILGSE